MDRIISHGGITNCYDFFNPDDYFLDYVSEDDGFAMGLLERPEFLRTDLFFLLQSLGEHVTMSSFGQVKTVPELYS